MAKIKLVYILIILITISCGQSSNSPLNLIAGTGQPGFEDGPKAQFNKPIRLAPYTDTSILVADIYNHAIREVARNGNVTTLAGGPDKQGFQDGLAHQAKLNAPHGIAFDPDNHIIYFAEASNHVVRKLMKNQNDQWLVSTVAGIPEKSGFLNGPADSALFNSPHAILIRPDQSIAVADIGNTRIRLIQNGQVSTLAGNGETGHRDTLAPYASFHYVMDMTLHGDDIYVADAGNHQIRIIEPNLQIHTMALQDTLSTPHGITVDNDGNVFIADMGTHRILQINKSGHITTLMGTGSEGHSLHELNKPAAVLVHQNNLWIADLNNHQIKTLRL